MNKKVQAAIALLRRAAADNTVLSDRALTQMLYLLDWKNTLTHGSPLTGLKWVFGLQGPEAASLNLDATGFSMQVLTPADVAMIDFVASVAINRPDVDLTRLVYSTYPIITGQKQTVLDLPACAKVYQAMIAKLAEKDNPVMDAPA